MDIFEQARKASPKDLKKVLKTAGKDATKRTNDKGQTLIHTAAEGGNHEGLKLLLTKYKLAHFVNIKDGLGGWTPLHYAAEGGHLECIDLLIHHGADVTATSRDGDSALHYLVRAKGLQSDTAHYYKLLKTILNTRGVDVNAQNMNGESALHLSAIGGHDEVANLLLNHSADIDLKSRKGETALHYATRYGNADIVTTLLERNADPLVSGTDGTPYSIASRDQQRKDIAELLSTAQAGRLQRKNTAPLSSGRRSSATVIEDNAATSLSTNSAPMPAVSYSPKPLPPVPRSTSFDTNGHQEGPDHWSIESLPSVDCLLRSCHVALSPRIAPSSSSSSSSSSPYSPQQSPALLLSSFLGQVDAALASRAQRPPGSLNYDFTYERDILTHVEKERETLRIVEERRKEFEERNNLAARAAFSPAAVGSDSPYVASSVMTGSGPHPVYHIPPVETPMAAMQPQPGMMTPPYHVGGYPQQQPFMHPPTTTTPTPTAMATRPPMHAAYSSPGGLTAEFGAVAAGGPPHAPAGQRQPVSGSGSGPHAVSLASSEPHILHHKSAHPLHVSRPKSGSTGDLSRNHGNALKSPRGGVAVLPPLPHSAAAADSNRRPRSNSARQSTPFNHAQETLYLKVISEHEELNTENVHLAVKHCGNDPKSVIAYVKAYERVKPMGYSQAHVVEALKAYGGGAPGLSPQEEDRQHQRMVAFLKLLVNKGFSPAPQVQNALSLFDYDVDKAEKFLSAYKTVSQMGFSDVQVREALLLSDSDSEQAIRYLLEGK